MKSYIIEQSYLKVIIRKRPVKAFFCAMERKYSSTDRQFNDEIGSVTQIMTRKRFFKSTLPPGVLPSFAVGKLRVYGKPWET